MANQEDVANTKEIFNLNDEQWELYSKFREVSKDITDDDRVLIRFFRARRFDVHDAFEQLKAVFEWRKEYNTDKILDSLPPKTDLVKKLVPAAFHGFDRFGRPIYIERTGMIDIPRLINLVSKDELVHNHVFGQEYNLRRCKENEKKVGHIVTDVCHIYDLKGLNLSHKKGMDFLKFLTELDSHYYPETLGALYLINTPWVFSILWRIARGWVDDHTRQKVHILGYNFKEELIKKIDPSELPVEFGGSCECQGKGIPCVSPAEDVKINLEAFDPVFTKIVLEAGEVKKVVMAAEEPGTLISWFFKTEKNDITFSVLWLPEKGSPVPVEKPEKVPSHIARIQGSYKCPGQGKLVVCWDNSSSWLTSKTVSYNLSVINEDEKEKEDKKET